MSRATYSLTFPPTVHNFVPRAVCILTGGIEGVKLDVKFCNKNPYCSYFCIAFTHFILAFLVVKSFTAQVINGPCEIFYNFYAKDSGVNQ